MAPVGLSRLASGLLFLPVVAQSSWIPRPFSHYESGAPAEGSVTGVQRFRHHEAHQLEDGSDLELHWEVDVDPATILSLDLEHPGVRLEECHRDRLVLHVDRSFAGHIADWRYITGSESLHGCSHLKGEHLYHRIERIESTRKHSQARDSLVVHFSTKELVSPSHMFSYCRYSFNLVPVQTKGVPEDGPPAPSESGRKLSTVFGSGDPQIQNSFQPSGNSHKSLLNFDAPTQLGNIGYNWNYDANSTTNPQFKYTFPGGVGFARLYKPYLQAHFSLNINFTSKIKSVEEPPHEVVTAELKGHGKFNLDLATAVNFKEERAAGVLKDVLQLIKLPGLKNQQGEGTQAFLNPIKFYFGGTPLTIKPGFSCQLKAYHIGLLKGSLRVGMSSDIVMRGLMTFDSNLGLVTNVSGRADHIKFTAPTWMLITQHFELGMMLEPMFWIKGGFGDMKDMEMGFSVRPYFNVSIMQEHPEQLGGDTSAVAGLAVYPFRAVGLPAGRNYAIRVGANGYNKTTAVKFSTGVVEFNDNVEAFDFGTITQNTLLAVKIEVALLENGQEPPIATSSAVCSSVVNGICKPSPVTAEMQLEGKSVYVHLTVVWNENALSILMSKMKSVALRFPSVSLQEQLAQQVFGPEQQQSLELRVTRNGRSYSVPLSRKENSSRTLRSRVIYDLGPCFLDSWKSTTTLTATTDRAAQDLLTPKLDLLIAGNVVGTGAMPPVSWDHSDSNNNLEHLAQNIRTQLKTLPVMVPLYPPDGGSSIVGTGEIEIDVLPAQLAAFWVHPHQAESFLVGQHYTFYWTLVNGEPGKLVNFTLTAMEVGQDGRLTPTNWQRPVQVSCAINSSVPVQRYDGGVPTCLFSYDIQIPSSLADRQIVMVASWLGKSMLSPHWMVSTPVRFSTSARRLQQTGRWGSQSLGAVNHTGFGKKVKDKLKNMAAHCSAQPLTYRVNAGMNFVEHMKNVIIPVGGGLGGLGDRPDYTSKPIPVMKQLGSGNGGGHLQDILPQILCSGGICEGMMPGCNKTRVNPLEISEINVKLSRVFRWKKHFGPKVRHMIAYGLALAPSAIQIGQKQATNPPARRLRPQTQVLEESRNVDTSHVQGLSDVEEAEFVVEDDDGMDPDFGVEEEVKSFRVKIDPHETHYDLTEELLQTFLRRGAFADLSDGREATHGPVEVVGFDVLRRTEKQQEHQERGELAPEQMYDKTGVQDSLKQFGEGRAHQAAATSLVCALLLGAAFLVVRTTVRQRDYTLVRHSDGLGDGRVFA